MATTTLLSIDEYLRKSYHPDAEYIDGELRARPAVGSTHGKLQSLISYWFGQHEEWSLDVAVRVRTRVAPNRVRLTDVIIDYAGHWPETLVDPPRIVIEILSPYNTYTATQRLAQDYLAMGIQNIWLLDPKTRTARVCEQSAWIEKTRLEVRGTEIYLDTTKLYAKLFRDAALTPPPTKPASSA